MVNTVKRIGCGICRNVTTRTPQQCLLCRFEDFVNFGQVFALFLGVLFMLTLNILCLLWMSLNATLAHIFVEHQIRFIFMGVVAKHKSAMYSQNKCFYRQSCLSCTFHRQFYFTGNSQRKNIKSLGKTYQWKLIFVIWSYSTWVRRHTKHVRPFSTWVR